MPQKRPNFFGAAYLMQGRHVVHERNAKMKELIVVFGWMMQEEFITILNARNYHH